MTLPPPMILGQTGAPLWFEIKECLRRAIDDGMYGVGDRLPTEVQLVEHFGVSRITVRTALDRLARERLIERGSGRGTFVRGRVVEQPVNRLAGFHEDMRARGFEPARRTIRSSIRPTPADIRRRLDLRDSTRAWVVEGILLADGRPMAVHRSWLPEWVLGGGPPASAAELDAGSLYDLVERRSGARLEHAEETIEARVADPRTAQRLGIRRGAPILVAHRLSFDASGRPVEAVDIAYRADRYRYRVELARDDASGMKRVAGESTPAGGA